MNETDVRLALIESWLTRDLSLCHERLEPASSDASFRRYFRVFTAQGSYIVMDAPPGKEDVCPYLEVGGLLEQLGAHVPRVHERDVARGLLLLEDLGTTSYLQRLVASDNADELYAAALRVLADIQVNGSTVARTLAPYDRERVSRGRRAQACAQRCYRSLECRRARAGRRRTARPHCRKQRAAAGMRLCPNLRAAAVHALHRVHARVVRVRRAVPEARPPRDKGTHPPCPAVRP